MVRRTVLLLSLVAAGVLAPLGAMAQSSQAPVVVLEIEKPADQRLLDWAAETIAETDAHLFVLQIDSPGIASGDPSALFEAVTEATAPVVAWVGAAPATAHGGMASLLNLADRGTAAPGVEIGYVDPVVVGGAGPAVYRPDRGGDPDALLSTAVEVEEPIAGYVDEVVPTVGQVIVGLDDATLVRPDGRAVTIDTAEVTTTEGVESIVPARLVEFRKPGLYDRFLRLAAQPETALFFLVAGIALATFEFYAAGVGVTAAVAVVALFLAGYGMSILPMNWAAVAGVVLGLLSYTWDFQRNQLGWRSLLGTVLLTAGGLTFTAAGPQFGPTGWIVVAVVIGAALFYGFALTTIARSRFSTTTIGRDDLIGRMGVATTDFEPDGVVDIDGAHWRGRSHREAGIKAGDSVAVTAVRGIVLEIEPREKET